MSVTWKGDEFERLMRARISRNMDAAALYLKGEVQRLINRGNADGSDPSAPGEPPKKVTGRLFQSIATDKRESPLEVTGVVGTNVEYARRLEYGFSGTDAAGRMVDQAPRPFLRPALAEGMPVIGRLLARD